jgi:hypothetical protein
VKAILLDQRQGENWIEADYTFTRPASKQPLGADNGVALADGK